MASERLLPTAAGLLLCRPAPHSAMLAPAMLRLLDIQPCYTPLDTQLSYALPDPRILLRSTGPRPCCHALSDSRTHRYCSHSLCHSLGPAIWNSCSTLDPQPVVTLLDPLLDPHSDIARWTLSSSSHCWTFGYCFAPLDPGSAPLILDPQLAVTRYTPHFIVVSLCGDDRDSSFAHSASGLAGIALDSRTRSPAVVHRCWPAPATGYRYSLSGPLSVSLTPVGVPSHREWSFWSGPAILKHILTARITQYDCIRSPPGCKPAILRNNLTG